MKDNQLLLVVIAFVAGFMMRKSRMIEGFVPGDELPPSVINCAIDTCTRATSKNLNYPQLDCHNNVWKGYVKQCI